MSSAEECTVLNCMNCFLLCKKFNMADVCCHMSELLQCRFCVILNVKWKCDCSERTRFSYSSTATPCCTCCFFILQSSVADHLIQCNVNWYDHFAFLSFSIELIKESVSNEHWWWLNLLWHSLLWNVSTSFVGWLRSDVFYWMNQ